MPKEYPYASTFADKARRRAQRDDIIVIGVDPGLRSCGVAVLVGPSLVACAVVRSGERKARGGVAWSNMAQAVYDFVELVVAHSTAPAQLRDMPCVLAAERMVVRSTRRDVDSDDLLELAGVAGAVAGRLRLPPMMMTPETWKPRAPKRIHHPRLLRTLTADEQHVVSLDLFDGQGIAEYLDACRSCAKDDVPSGDAHNAIDAVGIARAAAARVFDGVDYDGAPAADYVRFVSLRPA